MLLFRPLQIFVCGLFCSGMLFCVPAFADIDSAIKAYDAQQYDAAFKEFSQLAVAGDNRAKSFLAMMTLRGLGTPRNVTVGAQLAQECADGGEPTCAAIYAQLHLPGQGLAVDLELVRSWTRKAINGGDVRAGFLLWQAYQMDPANQYRVDGKLDSAKYDQLAHRSVEQRANQSEAIDALAAAAEADYAPARLMLATMLLELSGGGTSQQLVSLLGGNPELPEQFRNYLILAQQVQALGPTRAAPQLIVNALPAAREATAEALSRDGVEKVDQCQDFRLVAVSKVSNLINPLWLPLKNPLVVGTYPLRGSWHEQWTVFFCGAERTITAGFDADGMGGASYHFSQ